MPVTVVIRLNTSTNVNLPFEVSVGAMNECIFILCNCWFCVYFDYLLTFDCFTLLVLKLSLTSKMFEAHLSQGHKAHRFFEMFSFVIKLTRLSTRFWPLKPCSSLMKFGTRQDLQTFFFFLIPRWQKVAILHNLMIPKCNQFLWNSLVVCFCDHNK